MPNVPPPPASMTAWQWLIFVAIVAAFTLIQTWFIHKKIDATNAESAFAKATSARFGFLKSLSESALPLLISYLAKTPTPSAPTTIVAPDPHVAPLPPNPPAPPPSPLPLNQPAPAPSPSLSSPTPAPAPSPSPVPTPEVK